jgi:hypothetical protein
MLDDLDPNNMNYAQLSSLRERIDEEVRGMSEPGGPALRSQPPVPFGTCALAHRGHQATEDG